MASLQNPTLENDISNELLIAQITQLHERISKLESLEPSEEVNRLFTHLVKLCTPPSDINIKSLPQDVLSMRKSLINLCGRAEALLELDFSSLLVKSPHPLENLDLFPYYENYVKLARLENKILMENGIIQPKKVAFVGSGPLPLTSIVMAINHMKSTRFDNYDIDETANNVARQIVASDGELEKRMKFLTCDIIKVGDQLREYDLICLAALVGMKKEEKVKIIEHIWKHMKDGGNLLVRSANGARAFLYPVVEEADLKGFQVISIFHPLDDVINSVVLARKV